MFQVDDSHQLRRYSSGFPRRCVPMYPIGHNGWCQCP